MTFWLGWMIFILCVVVVALGFKVYFLRKAAREIRENFEEKVQSDTNTLVHLSGRDRALCELAEAVNDELRKLREERNRFRNGDAEVRGAITNISHDIRTPLAAILGYVELLQDEEVSENAASYIRIIQNRAELLQKLTEELFDYSIEVGRLFDRFYTVENARQSRGLGLSIAKLFVERMGGSITADYVDGCLVIKVLLAD